MVFTQSYCVVSGVFDPVQEMEVKKTDQTLCLLYGFVQTGISNSNLFSCFMYKQKRTTRNPTFNVFAFPGFVFVGCRQVLTILVVLCHAFRIQSMAKLIHRTAKKFLWSVSNQAADSETQREAKNKTNGTVKTKCDWIKALKPSLTKIHDCWLHLVKAIELVQLGANVNSLLSLVRTNDYGTSRTLVYWSYKSLVQKSRTCSVWSLSLMSVCWIKRQNRSAHTHQSTASKRQRPHPLLCLKHCSKC